ncbi:hypothetical protein GALL_81720 [mine drainage metagenome]|uniref:Uncharacterized protein n=1 Tax=mine drainage metagenome TaxID=410659 RepID=A0A1J5SMR4_9ZZZZ
MKQSLFRYMTAEHAERFVRRGEMLFRSLSYFRDYEDEGIRSDEFEGTRLHLPVDGLKVTKVSTGEVIPLPYTFESTAKEDDIFVSCLSTTCSEFLAEKFNAKICIEIHEPIRLLALIRDALARRPSVKNKHLEYGPVKYYEPHEPPIVDWALPEKIALSKLAKYSWQSEYRIAFAINGAFNVEKVQVQLVPFGERRKPRSTDHPKQLLKLGNISKLCTVHQF